MKEERSLGFKHHHTDEALRQYRNLPAEQKLRWLQSAWKFTVDFLPKERRAAFDRMRRGDI